MNAKKSILIVLAIWLLASFLGALPYLIFTRLGFVDSLFESVSGWTTTGATSFISVEELSAPLLIYRSATQWIGGLGILIFVLLFASAKNKAVAKSVVEAEAGKGNETMPMFRRSSDYVRTIVSVYTCLTILFALLFLLAGMSLTDAIVHSLSGISTGGFSSHDSGLAFFGSPLIRLFMLVLTIIGGMNFYLYYLARKRKPREIAKNSELRSYLLLMLIGSAVCAIFLFIRLGAESAADAGYKIFASVFEICSMVTTSGYSASGYTLWPTSCVMLLFILAFIGGCSSSAAGGIKVFRFEIILGLVRMDLRKKIHPASLRQSLPEDPNATIRTVGIVISYALIFLLCSFLLSLEGGSLMTAVSASLAALSNTGSGFADVGPNLSWNFFSPFEKIVLSVEMIAGRLEALTILTLVAPSFWRRGK
jgi:trk system potassium uptake protein TrkH